MISAGSVGTCCSKITLPASSTTHTDVSFTDTSRPTKCAISSLLPRCSGSTPTSIHSSSQKGMRSASKAEPQPPRYTIFRLTPQHLKHRRARDALLGDHPLKNGRFEDTEPD